MRIVIRGDRYALACTYVIMLLVDEPPSGTHAVTRSGQKGRITYNGHIYPDTSSACTALLRDLDPPQTLRSASAPDEFGDVHCVGNDKSGEIGFDQFKTAVSVTDDPVADSPATADPQAASSEPDWASKPAVDGKLPATLPPSIGAHAKEIPLRSGLRVLLIGPETDAEFAYADQVRRYNGTAIAVNPVRSDAAARYIQRGGTFVQSTVEQFPPSLPFDIIREDYPYPTGPMFGRAVDMVRLRLSRVRVGGTWSLITEKQDFVAALEAAIRAEGATVVTHPLPPAHEGVPVSGHLRDPARFSLLVTRNR